MDARLVVNSRRGKVLNGKWRIEDSGLQFQPADGDLADVKSGSPFEQKIGITSTDLTPRVEEVRLLLAEEATTHQFTAPAIVLGDANQSVHIVSESPEGKPPAISVNNGNFSFTVAPTFLGSLTALERDGVNQITSSYPKAGPHTWMNPWFGGIHPFYRWPGNQWFVDEQFSGEPVQRRGKNGIVWNGVKTMCDLRHKDERWLRMEIEYLTFGGSNILAIVYRAVNKTDAPQWAGGGLCVWPMVGGACENVIHYMHDFPCYEQAESTDRNMRVLRHRRHTEYGFETKTKRWAAFGNPKTGDVMSIIAPHPGTEIEVQDEGEANICLAAHMRTNLEPEESKDMLLWLAICNSVEEAQKYRPLAEIYELP